jgi:hypothetical protein
MGEVKRFKKGNLELEAKDLFVFENECGNVHYDATRLCFRDKEKDIEVCFNPNEYYQGLGAEDWYIAEELIPDDYPEKDCDKAFAFIIEALEQLAQPV